MIPRTIVPLDLRPVVEVPAATKPRRLSSTIDVRTVIPNDMPVAPLNAATSIPSHVPLDVLSGRTLVPRDMPIKPLVAMVTLPEHLPLSVLDSRVVVPREVTPAPPDEVEALEHHVALSPALFDVLDPDVLTTGDVNLLTRPVEERGGQWQARAGTFSVLVHCALIILAFFSPKLFPAHTPTQAEMDLARRQLSFVYLPPAENESPTVAPRTEPANPKIRVDPRILHQVAPSETPSAPPANPAPETTRSTNDLPSAPTPRLPTSTMPEPRGDSTPLPSRLENPAQTPAAPSLTLPRFSPGKSIEQSVQGAINSGSRNSGGFADRVPARPGGSGGSGGRGQGVLGGGVQMLTPDEGVDFTNYLNRLLASVKQNWYAIIPPSAQMGDQGRVVITFRILKGGDVPFPDPNLERTSGKEPLDRAAMGAIRASSPFEPLPPAFSGPYIELRFTFLYNLPLDYQ
jgi:TonB family protein